MVVDLFQRDDHCVSGRLAAGVVKLPTVIVGVVVRVSYRLATAKNVSRGENGAVRRLVKGPGFWQIRFHLRLTDPLLPKGPQQRPRATAVECKQTGLAGSAACGC